MLGVDLIEWLRIDDPIGAVAVHGICGIWGTLSLGLFATGQYGVADPERRRHVDARQGPVLRRRHQPAEAQFIGSFTCIVDRLGPSASG